MRRVHTEVGAVALGPLVVLLIAVALGAATGTR